MTSTSAWQALLPAEFPSQREEIHMLLYKFTDPKTGETKTIEAQHGAAAAVYLAREVLKLEKLGAAEARQLSAAQAKHTIVPAGVPKAKKG